jgi:hypothetical protein
VAILDVNNAVAEPWLGYGSTFTPLIIIELMDMAGRVHVTVCRRQEGRTQPRLALLASPVVSNQAGTVSRRLGGSDAHA